MITRRVDFDDHLAGFTYKWVRRFSKEVDELFVICLESGNVERLPENVKIVGLNTKNKIIKFLKFQFFALKFVSKVDGIFCHMNPEYTIAIGPAAKIFRKKIVSWYTHRSITVRLRLLEKIADTVITASKKSFRLSTKKLLVLGHGIDVEAFSPNEETKKPKNQKTKKPFTILTVGRISPTKDIESLIAAAGILINKEKKNLKVLIIGAPGIPEHEQYLQSLREMVISSSLENSVLFLGPKPNKDVVQYYQNADLFVNLSGTGSMDKAVLEAMACESMVLSSNEAFEEILGEKYMVKKNNVKDLAYKILQIMAMKESDLEAVRMKFRNEVVKNHN
ncbi:MAG: hypothetical protein COU27_00835, partial [Candidatus Levybacteria bacterium CG10_big_fil_rev_8_21_14_0_10_36_7]